MSIYNLKKDVTNIPLQEIADFYKPEIDQDLPEFIKGFARKYSLIHIAEWFWPQLLAKIAEISLTRTAEGKISGRELFYELRKDRWLTGALLLSRLDSKGLILSKQIAPECRNYCGLVPLIPSAYKLYKNVEYSEWDKSEVHALIHPSLYKSMTFDNIPELSLDEILEQRQQALQDRNPVSAYSLYLKKTSPYYDMPQLLKHMLLQTWCAHPSVRTKYMILNPSDWDNTPEPLVSYDLTVEKTKAEPKKQKPVLDTIPW